MNTSAHSEYGTLASVFIKPAANAFISEAHIEQFWRLLNFLASPDLEKALKEYDRFASILSEAGGELYPLPVDESVNMDSIYCRDAAIATNQGMIICNMGKAARQNEPRAEETAFRKMQIPILGHIVNPGTLEGGDVAWIDETTLAVGHGYRTNEEGIRQLTELVEPLGIKVITVPLPHYKGPADVFHLMSIFSPVDKDLAVVYSPLMPVVFRNTLIERGIQLVEVPEEEFDSMGCNVLALAPRVCLIVAGNPRTTKAMEEAGCRVITYPGAEISVKGGGGPTCLTRPWKRFTHANH